jgi:hypothetical protein
MEDPMSIKNTHIDRRTLLKGLASLPVVAALGYSAAATAEAVSIDDPTAKALEYTEKSSHAEQSCGNCGLYQGSSAATGPCPIFAGKDVAAAGWCKSWVIKS